MTNALLFVIALVLLLLILVVMKASTEIFMYLERIEKQIRGKGYGD